MATFNSAGSGNANADATWTQSGQPVAGSHVIIADGHTVTLTAHEAWGSVQIATGGTLAGGGFTLTLNDGGTHMFDAVGAITGTLDILITGTTSRNIDFQSSSGYPRNLTITPSSGTPVFSLWSAENNFSGDLTINGGTLSTSGSNYPLTVTGLIDVTTGGTITCNSSAVITSSLAITGGTFTAPDASGSLTITDEHNASPADGYAFIRTSGTFTHSSGTTTFTGDRADASTVRMYGVGSGAQFYNVVLNSVGDPEDLVLSFTDEGTYIAGDLTLTKGRMDMIGNRPLTVLGDVSIATGCILGEITSEWTTDISLGSLTIASGGTYSATSGTTTINGAGAGHSGQASALENQGTFTHNNGTILLTSAGDQDVEMDGTGNFYNLTFNKSNNDVIMHPNVIIENNLDVTLASDHTLRPASTTNTVTVHGITSLTTGIIGGTTAYDGNHNWGTLQINSGTFTMGSGTNNVTAIRNIGGTIN